MSRMLSSTSVDDPSETFSDVRSPDMPSPDALARAARQRRAELRLSQEDVRAASGLSITTIGKIERGDPDLAVQKATMRRLDLALGWPVGTAESWYQGRGGLVPVPADLERLAAELLPLLTAQLSAERSDPSAISVAGLPEPVVAAFEQLVRAVRNAIVHGR